MALVDLLTEDLGSLARLRKQIQELKAESVALTAELDETALGRQLADAQDRLAAAMQRASEYDTAIRENALTLYRENGNKGAAIGITVKTFKTMAYDKNTAETWLRANAPALLVVDWKKFESAAVALGAPVTVGEEPRVQIATDLSAYTKE